MPEPTALPLQRLYGQTLHHIWAPKLGRTVVLNSIQQLRLWSMLEANPGVLRYCERPSWPDDPAPQLPPDFWALRDGEPVWLIVVDEAPKTASDVPTPAQCLDLRFVTSGELDRHRVWIQNWLSLLPYLSMTASLDMASLRKTGWAAYVGSAHPSVIEKSAMMKPAFRARLHRPEIAMIYLS